MQWTRPTQSKGKPNKNKSQSSSYEITATTNAVLSYGIKQINFPSNHESRTVWKKQNVLKLVQLYTYTLISDSSRYWRLENDDFSREKGERHTDSVQQFKHPTAGGLSCLTFSFQTSFTSEPSSNYTYLSRNCSYWLARHSHWIQKFGDLDHYGGILQIPRWLEMYPSHFSRFNLDFTLTLTFGQWLRPC